MSGNSKQSGKSNRRSEILKAADKLMRSHGLAGVTTRQISREVGCSAGGVSPGYAGTSPGSARVHWERRSSDQPDESAGRGFQFSSAHCSGGRRSVCRAGPSACLPGICSARTRVPHLSMAALAEYIAAEQKLERIEPGADPKLAAYLLMSASFFHAIVEEFMGAPLEPTWERFARQLVGSIVPRPSSPEAASNRRSP